MADRQNVGLVVVSHSRTLALAAVSLASEMLQGRAVNIAVAAGLDETTFGTDAVRIKESIEEVGGPAGVVVLMDMGSAVLSTELALDLLDDQSARDRVVLSPAPIVEGLIVAAVAAAGGASLREVAAEARGALMAKAAHLTEPTETTTGIPGEISSENTVDAGGVVGATETSVGQPIAEQVVGVFTVANEHGLHARPAARLVSEVRALDASVQLRNLTTGSGPVPANSLTRVATLEARRDHQIEVRASGPQAKQAVEHLLTLAGRHFDEVVGALELPARAESPSALSSMLPSVASSSQTGPLPASPGIAIGPARKLTAVPIEIEQDVIGDPASEWRRIAESVAEVRRDIEHVRVRTEREMGAAEAGIFDAHLTLLADSEMLADVKGRIAAGVGAPAAWAACLAEVERQWAELSDPYLRERAGDVHAVGQQVLRNLTGATAEQVLAVGVLVARDLTPAQAAGLDAERVSGVVLAFGSTSSHAAILARARDIPLVVAAGPEVLDIPEGTLIIIDGGSGELHTDPDPEVLGQFRRRAGELAERRAQELALAGQPTVSRDNVSFEVAANLGSVADARSALASGADGAGLVRTEFLFLGRSTAPDQAEQEQEYAAIADAMGGRRVTLRTLDVGGDKPLPYLPSPFEQNPFLGLRGIRLCLDRRDLFREQLAAICQSARRSPTRVMFPMISTVGELLEARQVLEEAAGPSGLPADLRVGMMVEVPAAALKIQSFLPHLDFVSIGTNDLTQYTLAAERGNPAVASFSDALDPGVLQLIDRVSRAAHGQVDVAVCGEAASDELSIPVLVGLGVRELSVTPAAVPRVKANLRQLDVGRCRAMAQVALTLASPDDVRKLVLAMLSESSA
jgi:phosphoenolpyruvate-protein phosphotransferase/dihydroxyacetone kinase phosphotransfer subunit